MAGVFITAIEFNGITVNNDGDTQLFALPESAGLLSAPLSSENPEKDDIYLDNLLITNLVYQLEALQGIRLNIRPDADRSPMVGLKPGDLTIKMNNYSLTRKDSVEAAMQAYRAVYRGAQWSGRTGQRVHKHA